MCQTETSKSSETPKEKEKNETQPATDCRKAPGGELLMIGFDYVNRKALKIRFNDSVKEHVNEIRTNVEHYTDFNRAMLQFEEEVQIRSIHQYTHVVKVERFEELPGEPQSKFKYRVKITKKVDEISAAIKDGSFWSFNLRSLFTKYLYSGKIIGFENGSIVAYIFSSLKLSDLEGHFELKFCQNRLPFLVQYKALDYIKSHHIFNILINNNKYNEIIEDIKPRSRFQKKKKSFERDVSGLNFEQKQAVEYIVKAKNFPLPYLLYGPPGTGKTHTLIAAIDKIVNTTAGNVLVCANSNAVCDEITERLIGILDPNQMYRLYSQSYKPNKVKSTIEEVSNCYGDGIILPPLDFLYDFRVIICTLCTAGCLTRARRDAKIFQEAHFSHIIIDECASTHEPMSLVAIAGLCTSHGKIHSSIVLSGDPKQLDAVTKSRMASKMNFQTSFMEHLLMKPLYKRHPKTRNFNHTYITMLVKNYRSHPRILHVPNYQFYDRKLIAVASNEVTDWFINSKLLPTKDFPLIFRSVHGICERGASDGSFLNKDEALVVMDYIRKLLKGDNSKRAIKETDIGVVTPYRSQCQHMIDCCVATGLREITVGTAEVFQGKEKPIIIVSTVRGGGQGLGFVGDPKRLNVMITRAKCLLIIVGNPHDLCADENWSKMIKYCVDNGALIQGDRKFTLAKT